MTLSIQGIRLIATRYGYKEIGCNDISRVISFRGEDSNTRINVYYTTGTVGTCMDHPKKGKTQLFRRNINSLEQLESIFIDPRVHTGEGYYTRTNIRQQWKRRDTGEFLIDSARRWIYVGNATGLFRNERGMKTVIEICTKWDNLLWKPNTPPTNSEGRYGCGSFGGLFKILFEVVLDTCGDLEIHHADEINYKKSDRNREIPRVICGCDRMDAFMEAHGSEVYSLKHLFMSLRKDIRMELAQWFFARKVHRHGLTDQNLNLLANSKYHHAVDQAHIEYGQMMYPRHANMCDHCGTV